MTAGSIDGIASGLVDREGRLATADERLTRLQIDAGGRLGGPVAVPPIASVARLARNLSIPVSRRIVIGGEPAMRAFVRAAPDGESVRLTIADWEQAPPVRPQIDAAAREAAFAEIEHDGRWECDAHFGLQRMDAAAFAPGTRLTQYFRFLPDAADELPALEALALRTAFSGQIVEIRSDPGSRFLLKGEPRFATGGVFAGYRGAFRRIGGQSEPADEAIEVEADDLFGARLHSALRQPISRIVRNADALAAREEGPIDDSYVGYASDIAAASRHLLGLADDLRDLQAIEGRGFSTEAHAIDVGDVARRASGLLAVRAADKGVKLDPPAADEAATAIGDFRRVLQIIANLVGNAVRHSPEGSSIWIRIEEEDDLVAVIVADQGPGIAPENHERIFDKFERLAETDSSGSGLGLYISRRLARAMGGDLTVDSAPGLGARFVLTLPRSPDLGVPL